MGQVTKKLEQLPALRSCPKVCHGPGVKTLELRSSEELLGMQEKVTRGDLMCAALLCAAGFLDMSVTESGEPSGHLHIGLVSL